MQLSQNERLVLETIRDDCFTTISQVAHACGMPYVMCVHYFRDLNLAGLLQGFEVTYAGHKMLNGEEMKRSDDSHNVDVRIADVERKPS